MAGKGLLKREVAGAIIYGAIGLSVEIFVTGLPRLLKKDSGRGHVSVLMIILYMLVYWCAPYLFRMLDRFNLKNRFVRAIFVVLIIYAFEWSFGAICRGFGFKPWDYRGMGKNLDWMTNFSEGNINLLFAPLWYIYALTVEPVLKCIRIMVDYLVRKDLLSWKKFWGLTAKDPGC